MSTAVVTQNYSLWAYEAVDSDLSTSVQVVKASAGNVYQVEIDNTLNTTAGATSFVKLYNIAASGVTLGSSVPEMILPCPASTKMTFTLPPDGSAVFGTAISMACVTAGGTGGTTGPTNDVTVKVMFA